MERRRREGLALRVLGHWRCITPVSYTHLDVYKRQGYEYTSIHGDHRLYRRSGQNDTCYGTHFDRRIVERMAAEGLILASAVDIEGVQRCDA